MVLSLLGSAVPLLADDKPAASQPTMVLKAWGVPDLPKPDIGTTARLAVLDAFQTKFPNVSPISPTGLSLPGRTAEIAPLMQIAGDIAADVMYVNFRQSSTYIAQKFLYPLDKYVERMAGLEGIKNGHLLSTAEYRKQLEKGSKYEAEIADRVRDKTWPVMRRLCPYGEKCPQVKEWGGTPAARHMHIYTFPIGQSVMTMFYRKDLFSEADLPDRVPKDMDEMLEWARILTNPKEDRYGLKIAVNNLAWSTLSFLYSMGGRLVVPVGDVDGDEWKCAFDSEEAVETYYFVSRLFLERYRNDSGEHEGVVNLIQGTVGDAGGDIKAAMNFNYVRGETFSENNPAVWNYGPVPVSYVYARNADKSFQRDQYGELVKVIDPQTGLPKTARGSEFNAQMLAVYAGLENKPAKRDMAWEYIRFYDGPEARRILTSTFVEYGQAKFVRPPLLKAAGFPELVKLNPKGYEESYQEALKYGVPEPYGKNCQLVYDYVARGISQIRSDKRIRKSFEDKWEAQKRLDHAQDDEARKAAKLDIAAQEKIARDLIREHLKARVEDSNEKMLGMITPQEQSFRNKVGWAVAIGIFVVFGLVLRQVFKVFSRVQGAPTRRDKSGFQFSRYKWAYLLMAPALASIALWHYVPLLRGTVIAFQDYNVRGFTEWVGIENFANVLWDDEFWHCMWVSLKYALYMMTIGFSAPILLAFLLTEVPRGKMLYRTLYYLPAVLTGIVVMFLWLGFYGRNGMINQMLNYGVGFINWAGHLFNANFQNVKTFQTMWLDEPAFALLCCILPGIWAHMGPGCLIYLAALKTVPEEVYEAADIDGAGIWHKFWNVAVPSIRALIAINFIGVAIGAMQAGGGMMLAMTGGGPYDPYGATEVIGLHIFYTAYGFLRFGSATSMAWILGSMLIGFTVVRLQKLSKMEFRAAGAGAAGAGAGAK